MRTRNPTSGAVLAAALFVTALPAAAVERVPVESSHPDWKAIEIQLGRIAAGERHKDIDALRAIYAPDFASVQANGERWDRERTLAYQANSLKQVVETICLN